MISSLLVGKTTLSLEDTTVILLESQKLVKQGKDSSSEGG